MSKPKNILAALQQASMQDIEVDGLWFRVRKITSADMLEAGVGELLAAAAPKAEGEDPPAADRPQQVRAARTAEACVCAGVQQISHDGTTWQRCQVVMSREAEETGAGRIYVGSLPPGAVDVLGIAIFRLSNDKGAAQKRIASFLGE